MQTAKQQKEYHAGKEWTEKFKGLLSTYYASCKALGRQAKAMPWISSPSLRHLRPKKKACYLFLLIAELRGELFIKYCDAATGHNGFLGIEYVFIDGASKIAAMEAGPFAVSRGYNNFWRAINCTHRKAADNSKVHIFFNKDVVLFDTKPGGAKYASKRRP